MLSPLDRSWFQWIVPNSLLHSNPSITVSQNKTKGMNEIQGKRTDNKDENPTWEGRGGKSHHNILHTCSKLLNTMMDYVLNVLSVSSISGLSI